MRIEYMRFILFLFSARKTDVPLSRATRGHSRVWEAPSS